MFTVAGKSFAQYVAKRLEKDKIGFVPCPMWHAATDCSTYIKAPIPETSSEFLVYCHELGHCKSKQPERSPLSGFSSAHCNGTIECEVNAWIWALRYFRRLGFSFDECDLAILKRGLTSYTNNPRDVDFTNEMLDRFEKATGIALEKVKKSERGFTTTVDIKLEWADFSFPSSSTVILKGRDYDTLPKKPCLEWQPWHDLKNRLIKRQWKKK